MQEHTIGLQDCTLVCVFKVFLLTKSVLSVSGRAAAGLRLALFPCVINLIFFWSPSRWLVSVTESLCMAGPALTQFSPPQSDSFHSVFLLMMPVLHKQRHFLLFKPSSKQFLSRFLLIHCAKMFYITGLLVQYVGWSTPLSNLFFKRTVSWKLFTSGLRFTHCRVEFHLLCFNHHMSSFITTWEHPKFVLLFYNGPPAIFKGLHSFQ